jgi:hypothetical protein
MNDPIVDEVRRNREAHAASFQYDLDAIFRDLKEQEKRSGRKFVSFSGEQSAAADAGGTPNKPPLPPAPALSPSVGVTASRPRS